MISVPFAKAFIAAHRLPLAFASALTIAAFTSTPALHHLPKQQRDWAGVGGALVVASLAYATSKQKTANEAETVPPQAFATSKLSTAPLLSLATDAASHPHCMVIGKTGAGKSTVAQFLAAQCPGRRFAIAPHYDVAKADTEWNTCDAIFCVGRNYGNEEDESISYADLVSGNISSPTAYQIMRALMDEMNIRYQSISGFDNHECHNWILDESPAVARALGKAFGNNLAPLLFEARKIGLRLWIISQSDQVEALQIKGMGKIRDNFSYLYLGNTVGERLRKLKKRTPQVPADQRLAVVDSTPCLLPSVDTMYATMKANAKPERFVASMPERAFQVPSPVAIAKRGSYTEAEAEHYAQQLENLLRDEPTLTKTVVLKQWGFSGRTYAIGNQLYEAAKALLE